MILPLKNATNFFGTGKMHESLKEAGAFLDSAAKSTFGIQKIPPGKKRFYRLTKKTHFLGYIFVIDSTVTAGWGTTTKRKQSSCLQIRKKEDFFKEL